MIEGYDGWKGIMGRDEGETAWHIVGYNAECEGDDGMKDGSANDVRTDTRQNSDTIFIYWHRVTRKRGEEGNEDELELLGGTGSQSECLP